MEQLSFIPQVPIYHCSINCVWEECPNCKAVNNLSERKPSQAGGWYTIKKTHCPDCGVPLDWDEKKVDKRAIKTKEFKAMEEKQRKELAMLELLERMQDDTI